MLGFLRLEEGSSNGNSRVPGIDGLEMPINDSGSTEDIEHLKPNSGYCLNVSHPLVLF